MKLLFNLVISWGLFTGLALQAQMAVPPPMPVYQPLPDATLDQLLGPIALYPDPLIAEILPAATFPTQIVLANRYVTGGGDPNQIGQQSWDASVQALARYPNVLKWMDDNLNWTTELGQAFLNQQPEVMNSIQRLRASASRFGNLQSTPQQEVIADEGNIEIVPVDPAVIYVPVYQPDQVYYGAAFGSPFITFGIGWPVGVWLNGDFDWRNRHLIDWDRGHGRPANWWHESPRQHDFGQATVWRSGNHPGNFQASRGDRGWQGTSPARSTPPGSARPEPGRQNPQHNQPTASTKPRESAPVPAVHYAPVNRPPNNSAFIGVQSSHDTKAYSQRGQQSMQAMPHSAPAPAAPRAASGGAGRGAGGNGGNHSSGQNKH